VYDARDRRIHYCHEMFVMLCYAVARIVGKVVANVQALLDSVNQPTAAQPGNHSKMRLILHIMQSSVFQPEFHGT